MKPSGRRGFSLLEIVIASAILTLVAATLYMILASAGTTYADLSNLGDAQERARRVMDEMAKELRMADQTTMTGPPLSLTANPRWSDNVTFNIPDVDPATGKAKTTTSNPPTVLWSTPITYAYQLSNVDANHNRVADEGRIVRIQNGKTQRLCDYVKSDYVKSGVNSKGLMFTRTGDNLVIVLTFISVDDKNRVIDTTLRSSVTLRNSK